MKNFALVTGASKGIGKAIAVELAKRGYNLLLSSRSKGLMDELAEKLKQDFSVEVNTFVSDLSDESAPKRLLEYCISNNFPINILINNAGYGLWGKFDELRMELQLNMLRLNNENLVHITHLFIPLLKKNNPSYILNVSSTSAYQAVPTMAVYAASKIFVLSFSRALRHELKPDGVSVSCLVPGTTSTEFMDRAGQQPLKKRAEKVAMTPEAVAAIAVKGMFSSRAEIIPGFINWISAKVVPHLPKKMVEGIAASLYRVK